jgi:hypothetical protein
MSHHRFTACLRLGAALLATAGVLALSACGGGSGAPNNPYAPVPAAPGPLTVVPAEAIAFAGTPLVLSISGGTPPYQAFSSNPAALPVPQSVTGNTIALLANNVDATQPANVTIRDAAGATAVAEVSVRPSTMLPNAVTVTGNPACATSGGTLCAGQNGTASVLLTSPTGAQLAGRQVRFEVIQGDFAFVSTNPGQPTVSTLTVVTDQNGFAVATLQVPSTALTHIATLRATDVASGQFINSNFTIVAFKDGSAQLSVSPNAVTIPGPAATPPVCGSGVPVTYHVFGGTPPYRITVNLPTLVSIAGSPVLVTGGSFTAMANSCVDAIFTITDASGRFVNATLAAVLGPDSGGGGGGSGGDCATFSPPNANCPTISPSPIILSGCGATASADIIGGTGPFTVGSVNPSGVITPLIADTTLTVTRNAQSTSTGSVTVRVNAGAYFRDVVVQVSPLSC